MKAANELTFDSIKVDHLPVPSAPVRRSAGGSLPEGELVFSARVAFAANKSTAFSAEPRKLRRPAAVTDLLRRWVDFTPASAGANEEQVCLHRAS